MPTHKALSFHGASRRYKRLPHTKRRCARLLGTPSFVCLLAIASPTLACGRGDGIRTHGLLVPNQARYQTALHLEIFKLRLAVLCTTLILCADRHTVARTAKRDVTRRGQPAQKAKLQPTGAISNGARLDECATPRNIQIITACGTFLLPLYNSKFFPVSQRELHIFSILYKYCH